MDRVWIAAYLLGRTLDFLVVAKHGRLLVTLVATSLLQFALSLLLCLTILKFLFRLSFVTTSCVYLRFFRFLGFTFAFVVTVHFYLACPLQGLLSSQSALLSQFLCLET